VEHHFSGDPKEGTRSQGTPPECAPGRGLGAACQRPSQRRGRRSLGASPDRQFCCALAVLSFLIVSPFSATAPSYGPGTTPAGRLVTASQMSKRATDSVVTPISVTHSPGTAAVPGQTATLLPDGSWLLLGGEGEAGPLGVALVKPPGSTQAAPLSATLNDPRAWHTATLLPDGTVLVLGGLDASGNVIGSAELFDTTTSTSKIVATPGLTPRAYHTATLLTDGSVLIAGGLSSDGAVLRSAAPRTA
jgi:Galactose oxidase, central domain